MAPWDLDAFFMSLPLVTHSASLAVVVVFGGASHPIYGKKRKMKRLLFMESCWNYVNYECHLKSENVESLVSFVWSFPPHHTSRVHPTKTPCWKSIKRKFLAWALCSCGISTIFHCILPFFSSCYFLVTKRLEFSAFSRFYLRFSFHHKFWDCIQQRECGCLINIHPEIPDRFQLSLSPFPLHWDCAKTSLLVSPTKISI